MTPPQQEVTLSDVQGPPLLLGLWLGNKRAKTKTEGYLAVMVVFIP